MKKRPIRIEGDVAYVTLACGAEAIIDAEDAEIVGQYNWSLNSRGYVVTSLYPTGEKRRTLLMHRFIMGDPAGLDVDHKAGIKLDNRKAELRVATTVQNCCNQRTKVTNTSGKKGVSKCGEKWRAQIQHEGKKVHLGLFDTVDKAYTAFCEAAHRLHGEFARTE